MKRLLFAVLVSLSFVAVGAGSNYAVHAAKSIPATSVPSCENGGHTGHACKTPVPTQCNKNNPHGYGCPASGGTGPVCGNGKHTHNPHCFTPVPVRPTNTPVRATNTPVPPTATSPPVPTNTPVVRTNTPVVPTNTSVVPTNTPVRSNTNTPVVPTATNTSVPATATPGVATATSTSAVPNATATNTVFPTVPPPPTQTVVASHKPTPTSTTRRHHHLVRIQQTPPQIQPLARNLPHTGSGGTSNNGQPLSSMPVTGGGGGGTPSSPPTGLGILGAALAILGLLFRKFVIRLL